MKLLFVFPEPLPLPRARGVQVAWMADALSAAGADVTLAYVPSPEGHPLHPIGKEAASNLALLPVSYHWPFPFRRWHSVNRFAALLAREIDRIRPDAIFVRHFKLAERLLHLRPRVPLIYEAHEVFSTTVPEGKRERTRAQEAFVLERAAGVVYISNAVAQAIRDAYAVAGKEIVLPSGVSIPGHGQPKDWKNCNRHIIYAGSFFPWKGVDDLVAAASYLPGCRITLLGGDDADIRRLQAQLPGAGAEVRLLPRLPAREVMGHLQEACIAVLPNRGEGVSQFTSPLKLFEYMGAGCAVVAADLPSIREVVTSVEGEWFVPGDPRSLAAAIQTLVADPERAREKGRAAAELAQRYTWSGRARQLMAFIEESSRQRPGVA